MRRYCYGPRYGELASHGRRTSSAVQDPYAAHVAALKAIDPSGSYYTAQDYTASLSQAGHFVDAFGGSLDYNSPNVMASPTRMVDAQSGMVYVSADGADDTAFGSAVQTVAWYCGVFRSPPGHGYFDHYSALLEHADSDVNRRMGFFNAGSTGMASGNSGGYPSGNFPTVRRNGVPVAEDGALRIYDLSPITDWMLLTISNVPVTATMQLFAMENAYFGQHHFAALVTRYSQPTAEKQTQIEQELMRYYAPLIATNP